MKAGKDGKLKLAKNERQYGNFVIKDEEGHVKISDINGNLTHRISKSLLMGGMLEMGLKEKHTNWLHSYASLVWLFSNTATDEQFFLDINKVCEDCTKRHPDIYGIKEGITSEEDAAILQEAKETYEAIEELKKEE